MRNSCLIGGIRLWSQGLGKVSGLDGAWKGMDVVVLCSLVLIQGSSACKHHIRAAEKLALAFQQLRRGTGKGRKLIHGVIHRHLRLQVRRKAERHRGVKPRIQALRSTFSQKTVQQSTFGFLRTLTSPKMRPQHHHLRCALGLEDFKTTLRRQIGRAVCFVVSVWLFPEDHRAILCCTSQKVLWTLCYKMPSQMREDKQIRL